nr:SWIM zinc finger family protein [Haladaptatus sp. R4]
MIDTAASRKVSLAPLAETEETNPRSQRARAERMSVTPLGGGLYEVESQSDNTYFVDLIGGRCTCPDHMMRGVRCKHIRRVAIEINEGRVPPPGKEAVECTRCDSTVFVDEKTAAAGPHFCDHCRLEPGEPVVDRASATCWSSFG